MGYIDTDLDGIREIVRLYKETRDEIMLLRQTTQNIYSNVENDTRDALRRIQEKENKKLQDITNVQNRMGDCYGDVLKFFDRLTDTDFQEPLLKLQEILEDYHRMHLS